MDPRMYKSLIEDKPATMSDGSGLGHIARRAPMPSPEPMMTTESMELSGAPAPPQVAPNFSPPPPFTTGAVLPHVSSSLGATKPKMGGVVKKAGVTALAVAIAYGSYRAAKALAGRALESYGDDDLLPDLED